MTVSDIGPAQDVAASRRDRLVPSALECSAQRRLALDRTGFLGACSLVVVQLGHHALSRDEIQAWQIAVASRTPFDLVHNLRYEGHPALWHLLLWAASWVTGDPRAVQVIQAGVGLGLAALVWLGSPFRTAEKLLLSCSYYFLFEFTVMSRPYGLGVALCLGAVLVWTRWPERRVLAWGLLGLAANASFFGALLAGCLGSWALLDRFWGKAGPNQQTRRLAGVLTVRLGGQELAGLALFAALSLVAALTMWPAAETAPAGLGSDIPAWHQQRVQDALTILSRAFLPISTRPGNGFWEPMVTAPLWVHVVLGLILLLLARAALGKLSAGLGVVLSVWLGTVLLDLTVYLPGARHIGTIFAGLVAMAWIAAARGSLQRGAFLLLLASNAIGGGEALYGETLRPFSQAPQAAAWLEANGLDRAFLVSSSDPFAALIAGYLRRAVYYPSCACEGTYVEWTKARQDWWKRDLHRDGAELGDALRQLLIMRSTLVLIASAAQPPMSTAASAGLTLVRLATFEGSRDTPENYAFYRVEPSSAR